MRLELKRALFNRNFLLGASVMLICMLCLTLPEWFSIEWTDDPAINDIIRTEAMSSLQFAIYAIFFGGFILLIPFCASLPYAVDNVNEVRTHYLLWMVQRTTLRRYATRKIAVTAISGALVIIIPYILHALLWWFIAEPSDPINNPNQLLAFDPTCFYNVWYQTLYGLPMYISTTLGMGLTSAVWAVVSLAVTIWFPDKLLAIIIPSCFYYLWQRGLPMRMFGYWIPGPSALYNDALNVERLINSLIVYSVLLLISIIVYWVGLKRRACNG